MSIKIIEDNQNENYFSNQCNYEELIDYIESNYSIKK